MGVVVVIYLVHCYTQINVFDLLVKDMHVARIHEQLLCFLFRYNKETNELICDKLGVSYPIINGIPNLIPQDARKLSETEKF